MAGECDKNAVSELNPEMFEWLKKPSKSPLIITKLAFHLIRRGYPLGLQMLLPLGQGTILLIRKHRADRRWYFPKGTIAAYSGSLSISTLWCGTLPDQKQSKVFVGLKNPRKAFETTFAPNSPALIRVSIWSALCFFCHFPTTKTD